MHSSAVRVGATWARCQASDIGTRRGGGGARGQRCFLRRTRGCFGVYTADEIAPHMPAAGRATVITFIPEHSGLSNKVMSRAGRKTTGGHNGWTSASLKLERRVGISGRVSSSRLGEFLEAVHSFLRNRDRVIQNTVERRLIRRYKSPA